MSDDQKLTYAERQIYSEYIIADKTYPTKSTQDVTLVPTYWGDLQHIKLKGSENWTPLGIGELVSLTTKGNIKPIKYDMRKCDTMLVTSVWDYYPASGDTHREVTMMGKKFGIQCIDLVYDLEFPWLCKFYDIKRGDRVLARPHQTTDVYEKYGNSFEILRNFTMEKQMRNFFQSQNQR